MEIIIKIIISAMAILLASKIIPGIVVVGFYNALMAALAIGILNLIVRPILILLTLPITIFTFGLFTLVLNALLFWFAATFIKGFVVTGFVAAFLGSLLVVAISLLADRFLKLGGPTAK